MRPLDLFAIEQDAARVTHNFRVSLRQHLYVVARLLKPLGDFR